MKKFFFLMAAALMSVTMMAGVNDLLWDYTQKSIPTTGPDSAEAKNGVLYYGAYVNDAPGTNNGLSGVKLNNGGWAYFEKANVAGKLKLTFANRKNQTAYAVSVYNGTKEGTANPVKGTKIADTEDVEYGGYATIDLPAEVIGVYIERKTSSEGVLQKIEFKEDVARTFEDFKIEFRDNPYTVLLPTDGNLPAGVTVAGTTYNGGQHGVQGGTITVPVDGTVKFTIGACTYSNGVINVKKDGEDYATINNNAPCGETTPNYNQFVTWNYLGDAGTLTFEIGSSVYVPYFFAEAAEITPCEVIFKDQNGAELFRVETIEGATLDTLPDASLLPVAGEDYRFRGWFYTNGKKAHLGDPINGNTTIQAKVTPEEHVTVGSVQTYPLYNEIFYPEDHETIEMAGGYYHDGTYGWAFHNDDAFSVAVAGNAVVVLTICQYGANDAIWMPSDAENMFSAMPAIGSEGEEVSLRYSGPATTLTFTLVSGGENYLHKVTVYNVENFIEKDENTGYIMVPSGDAAAFVLSLAQAEAGDKIFLPNGTYDLGETVLTTISKNNISIIGQSMEGVIIKNAPDAKTESIDKTATLRIAKNISGTYIQDLTIQNALDYYKSDNGRAVALWDQGTQTVCKNVRLLSYQDTYYSNLQGAVKYMEDCEIHGTVDFICGDGSVYFKNNLLYAEKRKKDGGGSDALTANNGIAADRGFIFDGCTLKSECPVVSFGRAWNNTPTAAFLNTLVDYSAGEFSFESSDGKIQRWTKELMNANAWPRFGEYNTHLADGTVLTPNSNEVKFVDSKSGNVEQLHETVLSVEVAATITMEYILGDWAATAAADATQAICEEQWEDLEADAIYMVEEEGEFVMLMKGSEVSQLMVYDGVIYTLRKANARGGFGLTVEQQHQGVDNTAAEAVKVQKIIRNGQVIIVRDGKEFNVLGAQL